MNVLIIPENPRHDQHVLLPIVQAMFTEIGKPHANVRVCQDSGLGGIAQATDWECVERIINRFKNMVHVFLLLVDRDGEAGRKQCLRNLEERAAGVLGQNRFFFAEHAHQEIEVWLLAGLELPVQWLWNDIRAEVHVKEKYFETLAANRKVDDMPSGGRTTLAREASRNYSRIRTLCNELSALELRIVESFNCR